MSARAFFFIPKDVNNRLGCNSVTKIMEYEEILDRLETLRHRLAYVGNSLSKSESRLHESIKQTEVTGQAASRLAVRFDEIARDLDEAETGIKDAYRKLLKVKEKDEKECLEEQD